MFKILNNSKIVTVLFVAISVITSGQQIITDNIITLDSPDSGNKKYIADQRIEFLPGYSFEASTSNQMQAYINPFKSLLNSNDFENHELSSAFQPGSIQGMHDVNGVGGFQYTIPVEIPLGTNGMVPELNVVYNSHSGKGLLGLGWSLSGLSAISRTVKPLYLDDHSIPDYKRSPQPIKTSYEDFYNIDGQVLTSLDGQYGMNGTTYGLIQENYSRITSYGQEGEGPVWFELQTKDGMIVEYGRTPQSQIKNYDGTNLVWMINKISDRNGNYLNYVYETIDDELLLKTIEFTGNSNSGLSPYNKIELEYIERNDKSFSYIDHKKVSENHLVKNIRVFNDGNELNRYEFEYGFYKNESYLNKVNKYVNGVQEFNPLVFNYDVQSSYNVKSKLERNNTDFEQSHKVKMRLTGDFDGDGFTDLVSVEDLSNVDQPTFYEVEISIDKSLNESFGSNDFETIYQNSSIIGSSFSVGDYSVSTSRGLRSGMNFEDFTGNGRSDVTYFLTSNNGDVVDGEYVVEKQWIDAFSFYRNTSSNGNIDFINAFVPINSEMKKYIKNIESYNFNGDFNGDGINDIIFVGTDEQGFSASAYIIHGRPEFDNGIPVSFGVNTQLIFSENTDFDPMELASADKVFVLDFDGDGKQDLLIIDENNLKIFSFETKEYLNVPQANIATLIYEQAGIPSGVEILVGDFNGDGKSDLLSVGGGGQSVLISYSTGRYLESLSFNVSGPLISSTFSNNSRLILLDVDGDGKTEIVHFRKMLNTSYVEMNTYFIENNDLRHTQNYFYGEDTDFQTIYDLKGIVIGRFMETNTPQILIPYSQPYPEWDPLDQNPPFTTPPSYYMLRINFDKSQNFQKLTGILNGDNLKTEVSYNFSNSDYDENLNYPYFALTSPIITVEEVTIDANNAVSSSFNRVAYDYNNGVINMHGYGFLGFQESIVTNIITDYKSIEKYELNELLVQLMPHSSESYKIINNAEQMLANSSFEWEVHVLPNNRNVMFMNSQLEENLFEDYFIETNIITYDITNGNVIEKMVNLNNQHSSHEEFVYGKFGTDLNFENKITRSEITEIRNGEAPFSSISVFDYDENTGLPIETIKNFGTQNSLAETYNYDLYGNIIKTTFSAIGAVDRVEEVVFDNKGRLPIKMINIAKQIAIFEYHPYFNKVLKVIDANGLISESSYDSFGNLVQTIDQQGIISTIEREWVNTSPSITSGNPLQADDVMWSVKESVLGEPDRIVYYNKYGQIRMKETDGFNSPIISVTTYDNEGQVVAQTDPHFPNSPDVLITTFTFDDYDRLISATKDNETSSYEYILQGGNKETIITDPDGNTRKSITDVTGQLISTTDNGGTITHSYYSHGGVKEITKDGVVIASSLYDDIGRQKELIDINTGAQSYTYAPFGEMFETNSENGFLRSNQFDDFGRINQINYESTTNGGNYSIQYEYVEQGAALNSVSKITTSDGIEEMFGYDALGRVQKISEVIENEIYSFEFEYNGLNQPVKTIYPNGFSVQNEYNTEGYLTKVTDEQGNTLWEGLEQNSFGLFTSFIKGDGITTNYTFDAHQRIADVEAQNIIHHVYGWDNQTGNMSFRKDLVKGLEEFFEYDNLDRLTIATASAINTGLVMNYHETNYFSNGNIKDKTGAGDYTYHPDKINAVVGVTNEFTQITSFTQSIEYNIRNKASTISEGAFELQFQYGHDNQRRKTTLLEDNNIILEKYFFGLYEKEIEGTVIRHINYIMTGEGISAMVVEEEENGNTATDMYFTYKDHLGSIVALTDVNGDIILEQSFDAWGRYRNTDNWTYNNISESPTWLRGYTGHEHLPQFDLINMNGRIYDPILGRMLSPDRYIQDPMSTQSYNRYSYVWNNPLRYTDPSGDAVVAGIIIGAAVGAYIGGSIANNTINITEWEWDGNTVGGIVKGAMFGAFAGAGIGAALAGKLGVKAMAIAKLNASTIKSGLVSGGLNMMYNYEEGQSFGTSLGYFGSGFVGGAIGVDLVAPLIGMASSGVGNMVVFGVDSGGEATNREYAQKFVSGALNAYAGISIFSKNVSYMKMASGDYIGGSKTTAKAWRAGWINQASDFAYSSQDAFNNRSIGERILMFGAAGASVYVGKIGSSRINEIKRGFWKGAATFGVQTSAQLYDYYMQQTIYSVMNNNPSYSPWNYKDKYKKISIGSYKGLFYGLTIK